MQHDHWKTNLTELWKKNITTLKGMSKKRTNPNNLKTSILTGKPKDKTYKYYTLVTEFVSHRGID